MLRVALALLFGMLVMPLAQAQSMGEAGAKLADDFTADLISSLPRRPTTVSLEIRNLTALAPAELSSFRAALREGLRKQGLQTTVAGHPGGWLRVTSSGKLP